MRLSEIQIGISLLTVLFTGITIVLLYLLNEDHTNILTSRKKIDEAHSDFLRLYTKDEYFSKRDLIKWINQWNHLSSVITLVDEYNDILEKFNVLGFIGKSLQTYFQLEAHYHYRVYYLKEIFEKGFQIVKNRNEEYIKAELDKFRDFFDIVEKDKLTLEQRRSIIIDEAHNLLVAGAGAGKTSTIIGKTGYLLKKKLVEPEELLLLSFARAPNKEMQERIEERLGTRVKIKTFHSLGYEIIRETLDYAPKLSRESTDNMRLRKKINDILKENLNDISFLNKVHEYFIHYLKPVENETEFITIEEYEEYIRSIEIRALNGIIVKSIAECEIANFFHVNNIECQYETEYPHIEETNSSYHPDFYLPKYDIWIEHYGIDSDCDTAPYIDRWTYLDQWYWKRKIHEENKTTCIETYSHERQKGKLISNLIEKLQPFDLKYNPLLPDQTFDEIKKLGDVNQFSQLLLKFLNLFKSSTLTFTELREKTKDKPYSKRYLAFTSIFETIYNDYQMLLHIDHEIDFHDMINLATDQVKRGEYQSPYRYILVDEFQDISQGRYRLLKSLLTNPEDSKLFCVGDDWQSIYRFTGSDLSIMTNFDRYFQPNELMFLTESFRFPDEIGEVSSTFIMKNPQQYRKDLLARQSEEPSVTIVWYESSSTALVETLQYINSSEERTAEIAIIGRYNARFYNELNDISFDRRQVSQTRLDEQHLDIKMSFKTAHTSKGSESDYVIMVGVKADRYGFPCEIEDDPVINLVLSQEDQYPFAEERRVFYVALTRARKQVFILADRNQVSQFMLELIEDNPTVMTRGNPPVVITCPECQKGIITKLRMYDMHIYCCNRDPVCRYEALTCPQCSNGFLYQAPDLDTHYYCSNPECSAMPRICPRCGGYLEIHEKNGRFWGCNNHRITGCRYTEPILG